MATLYNRYEYSPLPTSTSIRLIRLKQDTARNEFSCSFEVVDLLHQPEYMALSYCWGEKSRDKPVRCDGGSIMVTCTAWEMLKAFSRSPALVWADIMSIDQDNTLERNQQVSIMADIYSKARTVTAWLGPDLRQDAEPVFQGIKTLVKRLANIICDEGQLTHINKEQGEICGRLVDGTPFVSSLSAAIALPDKDQKAQLTRFFNLPWFSRTWVLQEVGLAAEANILWGESQMEWNVIGVTAMFLMRYARLLLDDLGLTVAVEKVYHLYTAFSPFTPQATFFHLLCNVRRFEASNKRDKVFALLSHPTAGTISWRPVLPKNTNAFRPFIELAMHCLPSSGDQYLLRTLLERKNPQADANTERLEPLLKADYGSEVSDVYRNVALQHMSRTKTIEILTAVHHDPTASSLPSPSWVPQWNHCTNPPILGLLTSTHFASANKDAVIIPSPLSAPNALILRGTIVSKISYASTLVTTPLLHLRRSTHAPISFTNVIASTWEDPLLGLNQEHEMGATYPQTVLFVSSDGRYAKLTEKITLWAAYLHTWTAGKGLSEIDGFDFENDAYEYSRGVALGEDYFTPAEEKPSEEESTMRAERYRASVATVANHRKFFVTKKNFFGLGPGAMREGDWVTILLGANVPFVLREVGGEGRPPGEPFPENVRFQLVGECYVHGLMQGQGIKQCQIGRDVVLV